MLPPILPALVLAAAPPPPSHVAPVVAAERAFAAEARQAGTGPAFARYVDPDRGLLFTPDPVPAKPLFDAGQWPRGLLRWWPAYAGIAASGELGFSTGPYEAGEAPRLHHGWFLTIWGKRPDGSWRWLLDHGTPTQEAAGLDPAAPVEALAPAERAAGGSGKAWNAVLAAEVKLAAALLADAPRAYAAVLADEGRIMRAGRQPAIGRPAFEAAAAAGPKRLAAWHCGGGVSKAGDFAWTFGDALWEQDGGAVRGHYVRVWQRRGPAWKLIVDETVPVPRPPH